MDDSVFSAAGIYHYVVTQTAGSYEGITYSTETYDVYLYVMNNTDLTDRYVGYVVSVKQGETAAKADLCLLYTSLSGWERKPCQFDPAGNRQASGLPVQCGNSPLLGGEQ